MRLRTMVASLLVLAAACGRPEPSTDAERLARGRQIVEAMSAKLAAVGQFTVALRGTRDSVRRSGERESVSFTDVITVRRPNRLHSRITGEKRDIETWYDGSLVTVAGHKDKVFAQARMPETIDRTLDALAERFGMVFPVADLFYTSAAKALLSETTTGGYVGQETVEGIVCDHVAFQDSGSKWELWIPAQGDPLPRRLKTTQERRKDRPTADIVFTAWNLEAQTADATFVPKVPDDYEGIAMLQRMAILENMPPDTEATQKP